MKLKFYLRGLGVGIVFTALIFSFIIVPKYKLTDSEIRNRARQLGMVDKAPTPTSDMSVIKNTGTPSPTPTATPSATPAETPALTGDPEITPETTDAPSSSPAPTDTGEPSPSATSTPTPTATSTPVPTATNTPSPTPTSAPSSTPLPTATTAPSPTPTSAPTNTPSPVPTSGPIVDGQEVIIQVTSGMSSELLCQKLLEAGLITNAHDFDLYLNLNGYDKRIQVGTFKLKKGMTYEQIAKIVAR